MTQKSTSSWIGPEQEKTVKLVPAAIQGALPLGDDSASIPKDI